MHWLPGHNLRQIFIKTFEELSFNFTLAEKRPQARRKRPTVELMVAQQRAECDISETALTITISKFRKHFSMQTTPHNL